MMISVALLAIFIRESVRLSTGSEFFSIFPLAIGGVGGSTTLLFASLLSVLLSHRCCCCSHVIVVVMSSCGAGGCISLSLVTCVVVGVVILPRRWLWWCGVDGNTLFWRTILSLSTVPLKSPFSVGCINGAPSQITLPTIFR